MARRCARWRIHCDPPSWLRPRREAAPLLPSIFNVSRYHKGVKPAREFSSSSISYLPATRAEDLRAIGLSVQSLTDCCIR
jgi:hypothetical protein